MRNGLAAALTALATTATVLAFAVPQQSAGAAAPADEGATSSASPTPTAGVTPSGSPSGTPSGAPSGTPSGSPSGSPSAAPVALTLAGPAHARKRSTVTFVATATSNGVAAPGTALTLQSADSGWHDVSTAVTDDTGAASFSVTLDDRASQRFRAVVTDDPAEVSAPQTVSAADWRIPLVLAMPSRVKDGRHVTLRITWRTAGGVPAAGATVVVHRRQQGRAAVVRTLRVRSNGRATLRVMPRWDSTWWVSGRAGSWYAAAKSGHRRIDNLPPGRVVVLPKGAPAPAITLPPQPRVLDDAPDPVVTPIPDALWNHMVGTDWHAGCPVGRSGLRLLRITYWGFDGYRHRGELVAATWAMSKFEGALADMYRHHFPIRAMYPADHFGYSSRTHGGNDFAAMKADDTSAFNCRLVDNGHALSPHAYGDAIDFNTWENPYRSAGGLVPDSWWQFHSLPLVTARSRTDPLVRLLARHGISWPYGLEDTQHFSAR